MNKVEYLILRSQVKGVLERARKKICSVEISGNSNPDTIRENHQAISVLEKFFHVKDEINIAVMDYAEDCRKEGFREGYAKGRKDTENITNGIPHKYYDREGYRIWHNNEQKKKWDDHH